MLIEDSFKERCLAIRIDGVDICPFPYEKLEVSEEVGTAPMLAEIVEGRILICVHHVYIALIKLEDKYAHCSLEAYA